MNASIPLSESHMFINLQTFKIAQSMGFDQKNIFHRAAKLLEEQGELSDAIDLDDLPEMIEESVDNLLVVTSIAFVLDHTAMDKAQALVNDVFLAAVAENALESDPVSIRLFLKYVGRNGKLSDAIQKQQKIAASSYKGFLTSEETLVYVLESLTLLMKFMATLTHDVDLINRLILKKNDKWLAKSIEGREKALLAISA